MKNVLIVDDEKIVLDVLERILNRLGHTTVSRNTGEAAFQTFENEMFDLILMDVLMPGINGFQLAKKIRDRRPDQKIVMISGMGENTYISENLDTNGVVQDIISKPFSFNTIRSIMDAL